MNIKISGVDYELDDNLTAHMYRVDNLNMKTVELGAHEKIDLKTMLRVEILDEKWFLLDWEEELISFNPKLYNYTLNLVDTTIAMQNVVLPNRSVKRRLVNPKTTLEVLTEYLAIYAPRLSLSPAFDMLDDYIAVEHVWQTPTLYEVFNDLISAHINAFVRMDGFDYVGLEFLDDIGNEITNYDTINSKTDFENYTDKLNVDLKDARLDDGYELTEMLYFKTPNWPKLKDNDFIVETSQPIDEIISFRMGIEKSSWGSRKAFSLTNHIHRKEVYDTFLPSISTGIVTGLNYKRNALYYNKGDNKILGWNYNDDDWIPIVNLDNQAYKNIFVQYFDDNTKGFNLKTAVIKLTYKPIIKNTNINLIKMASASSKTTVSGQNNPSININAFGRTQRSLLNSVGNQITYIYGTGTPPQLMDYIGNNYVNELQINYSSNVITWMATAQENYGELNLNTAVAAERRYTERVGLGENVITNHIEEFNYEFKDNYDSNIVDNTLRSAMLENFKIKLNGGNLPLDYYVKFHTYNLGKEYIKTLMSFNIDNSWVFKFNAVDNYSLGTGYKINAVGTGDNTSYKIGDQTEVSYVDNNGEFENINVNLYSGLYNSGSGISQNVDPLKGELNQAKVLAQPALYGDFDYDNAEFIGGYMAPRYKDDREITYETIQFNFLSNNQFMFYEEAFNIANLNKDDTFEEYGFDIYINFDNPLFKYGVHGTVYGTLVHYAVLNFETKNSIILEFLDGIDRSFYGWIAVNYKTGKPIFSYNGSSYKLNALTVSAEFTDFESINVSLRPFMFINNYTHNIGATVTANYSFSEFIDINYGPGTDFSYDETIFMGHSLAMTSSNYYKNNYSFSEFIDINYEPGNDLNYDETMVIEHSITLTGSNYYRTDYSFNKFIDMNYEPALAVNYDETLPMSAQIILNADKYEINNYSFNKMLKLRLTSEGPNTLRWAYKGVSSQPICFAAGYNPIGITCSIENEVMVVAGIDIGMSGNCHELICKKI